MIPTVHSIKTVERQYTTGEEPILVLCSDRYEYICKYVRSRGAAYKLTSELIGAQFAQVWGMNTPNIAYVNIRPNHWVKAGLQGILAFGSRRMESVVDINPSTITSIKPSLGLVTELLTIALFDFWVANEDRNTNNANLMYDLIRNSLVSIDYGCIFNTAMYDYPMAQLTTTDTILASELFHHLQKGYFEKITSSSFVNNLLQHYQSCVRRCQQVTNDLQQVMPKRWNVPYEVVGNKIIQLFDPVWTTSVWDNFMECLLENKE